MKEREIDPETGRPPGVGYGECWCGCGGKTALALFTYAPHGWVEGEPKRYVLGHCNTGRGRDPLSHVKRNCGYETECWVSTFTPSMPRPYVRRGGRYGLRDLAYRLVYAEHVGPIPDGHDVHHLCDNGRCVNPDHLELLTRKEHGALHRNEQLAAA